MFTLFILSVAGVLLVSFFCSLSESVLLSIDPIFIQKLRKESGETGDIWFNLKKNISRSIATILILNTIANTGGAAISGVAFSKTFGDSWFWLFTVLFTIAVLLGSEIFPKLLGVAYKNSLAEILARPLILLIFIMKPLIVLCEVIFKKLGSGKNANLLATSDIITLTTMARSGKVIGLEQENIIVNAIRLGHSFVETAMVPIDKITFLSGTKNSRENIELIKETMHTRYPISSTGSPKDLIGYVNIKRILTEMGEKTDISFEKSLQDFSSIKVGTSLLETLRVMIKNKKHMLLVRNPKNEICGLITMEDINSELVGYEII